MTPQEKEGGFAFPQNAAGIWSPGMTFREYLVAHAPRPGEGEPFTCSVPAPIRPNGASYRDGEESKKAFAKWDEEMSAWYLRWNAEYAWAWADAIIAARPK